MIGAAQLGRLTIYVVVPSSGNKVAWLSSPPLAINVTTTGVAGSRSYCFRACVSALFSREEKGSHRDVYFELIFGWEHAWFLLTDDAGLRRDF